MVQNWSTAMADRTASPARSSASPPNYGLRRIHSTMPSAANISNTPQAPLPAAPSVRSPASLTPAAAPSPKESTAVAVAVGRRVAVNEGFAGTVGDAVGDAVSVGVAVSTTAVSVAVGLDVAVGGNAMAVRVGGGRVLVVVGRGV